MLCKGRANGLRSGLWAGRDSLREQKKLQARKMLENRAESHKSTACFVGQGLEDSLPAIATLVAMINAFHDFRQDKIARKKKAVTQNCRHGTTTKAERIDPERKP